MEKYHLNEKHKKKFPWKILDKKIPLKKNHSISINLFEKKIYTKNPKKKSTKKTFTLKKKFAIEKYVFSSEEISDIL